MHYLCKTHPVSWSLVCSYGESAAHCHWNYKDSLVAVTKPSKVRFFLKYNQERFIFYTTLEWVSVPKCLWCDYCCKYTNNVYITCEHTLTNTESENSVSFVFATVRPNTGITVVSGNSNKNTKTVKKKRCKVCKPHQWLWLIATRGSESQRQWYYDPPSIAQLPGYHLEGQRTKVFKPVITHMLDKINDIWDSLVNATEGFYMVINTYNCIRNEIRR